MQNNWLDTLKFDADGLIPAVVQDFSTGQVLMLAYMNRESLEISLREKSTCFWSRSRGELWRKGATSGNTQRIVSITADCDSDALVVEVRKEGPACHTGAESCFFRPGYREEGSPHFSIDELYRLLEGRKKDKPAGSYTTYLFEEGDDKILKKVGEESTEVVIAAKNNDNAELIYEISDLCYHTLVLMVQKGVSLDEIRTELAGRHIVDKKTKQEKMQ